MLRVKLNVIKNLLFGRWTIKQAMAYQKFCENGLGLTNLCASLPRSGYNLLATSLSVAVDLERGGKGDFYWRNGRWEHPSEIFITCDNRAPLGVKTGKAGRLYDFTNLSKAQILEKNFVFHTHETYETLIPATKNLFNTVIIIRELFPQITSQIKHQLHNQENLIDYFVNGHLKQSVMFLNSWGKRLERQENIMLASYNQIAADNQAETLEKVARHFNIQVSAKNCEFASLLTNRDIMISKIPITERPYNKRVSVEHKIELTSEIKSYVKHYVDRELREGNNLYEELGLSVF